MYASVVLTTTNKPNPCFSFLDRAVAHAEMNKTDFTKEFILTIDMHPDGQRKENDFKYIEERGWRLVFGKGGGRTSLADNLLRGVEAARNEWVLLCQDDSFLERIPSKATMHLWREIGWLCYNADFNGEDPQNEHVLAYLKDDLNYRHFEGSSLLIKDVHVCGKYLITLPAAITRREYYIDFLDRIARKYGKGLPIELALSKAWKSTIYRHPIAIYLQPVDTSLKITQDRLHNLAYLTYWNNDKSLRHPTLDGKKHIWM